MAFTASNGRTQTAMADINITPLVDVVLVLLIIFMVTAPVLQSGIDVSVPKTRTVKEITEERLVITINKDQRVFLGNDTININEIGSTLKKKIRDPRNQSIFLRADENVPFGAFATVMDAVKQAGITNLSIVTQPLDQMAANADIFLEHDNWGRALAWSAGLHVGITAFALIYTAVFTGPSGQGWGVGGGGEAMGATLVSTVPLAVKPNDTQNVLANESKGLTKSQPKIEQPEPDAIDIQGKNAKIKPKKQETVTKDKPQPVPEPETNQVAFGEGGPVSGPYGTFSAGGAKGGFGFTGGGGDFGTRFSWYVQAVQRKVSENWLKYEIDPRITTAQRIYVTFDIARDGHPVNPQVEQSSGVPSLDNSAVRAIQRIDTFGPLPPEYSGNKISVEFWFDFKR